MDQNVSFFTSKIMLMFCFCSLESVTSSWWMPGVSLSDPSSRYRAQEVKGQRLKGYHHLAGSKPWLQWSASSTRWPSSGRLDRGVRTEHVALQCKTCLIVIHS